MSDVRTALAMFSDGMRQSRSHYHLTLGKLIAVLETAAPTAGVRYVDTYGGSPGRERSYRGFYSDLAFEDTKEAVTVAAFLAQCKNALGGTYCGYKGGDYRMEASTPLWRATYGCCGEAIVSATAAPDGTIILECRNVDND